MKTGKNQIGFPFPLKGFLRVFMLSCFPVEMALSDEQLTNDSVESRALR
jgi:hypothetical protein